MDRILWKLGGRTAECSWGRLRKKRRKCSSLVLVEEYVRQDTSLSCLWDVQVRVIRRDGVIDLEEQ